MRIVGQGIGVSGVVLLTALLAGCVVPLPNQLPVAVIKANPTTGDAPLTVSFDGRDCYDPDGGIVDFYWEFGDGAICPPDCSASPGTVPTPSHKYMTDWTFTATLTVTDDEGATDTASMDITAHPNGLMSWWKFDEGSGTSVLDSSGQGNNGTIQDGTYTTACISGTCLEFDGVDDYIIVPDAASLSPVAITVQAWVFTTGLGIANFIVAKRDLPPDEDGYELFIGNDDNYRFNMDTTSGAKTSVGPAPHLNSWEHVAGTYDGVDITVYVNGDLKSTEPWSGSFPSTIQLLIGAEELIRHFFQGRIDEVRIYSRALPQGEIEAYYEQTRP